MTSLPALVASYAPGATPPAAPQAVPDDAWRTTAHAFRRERLTGLALAAAAAGWLDLEPRQLDDLGRLDRIVQSQALRAERLTLSLLELLRGEGVDHRVLKGPTLAHGYYPDPAHRPFADVDLLLPADRLEPVLELLVARGADRLVPELRPGFDRRFAKSVTLRDPSGVEIDLHRTLALGPLAHLVPVADLWADRVEVEVIPGRVVDAFGPDLAFLHACVHAVTGRRPGALLARDVVITGARADLARCGRLATAWRATAVVGRAVDGVRDTGLEVPEPLASWRRSLRPTGREERVLRSYLRPQRSGQWRAIAGAPYVPGVRDKASYLAALLLPSRDNLAARSRSVAGHGRRVVRGLLRRGGR